MESACYVVREEARATGAAPRSAAPCHRKPHQHSSLSPKRPARSLVEGNPRPSSLLRGQYQDAENLLTEALESGALAVPTQISALGNRGIARWRLSNLHAAIDDFNAALRLSPEEAMIYNNRGNVLLELRHYEEAATDFGRSPSRSPELRPSL